jgi:hypothetical protein
MRGCVEWVTLWHDLFGEGPVNFTLSTDAARTLEKLGEVSCIAEDALGYYPEGRLVDLYEEFRSLAPVVRSGLVALVAAEGVQA